MILTKLYIPTAGNHTVHRPELFEKLNLGLTRKLILISAPAGFGKSTLVCDWIVLYKISACWFSIDKGDNDPVEFIGYVIASIQNIKKDFGLDTLKVLKSPNKPSIESIASLLINEIVTIEHHFLLVLDDFHSITNSEIVAFMAYFLDHLPNNIHISLLTRADPSLPMARLRSRNQMVELRSSDLSFSSNDIHIYFNKKLKLKLSAEDVHSLETKTEGWIAGLQLISLSLQNRPNVSKFIRDFEGDNRFIMDYLIEEVLKIQRDDIKEFLLQTSLLEQLSAPLCDAILNRNDSQQVLEQLELNNMFIIPLDDERKWYRYHHLFSRLLTQRLQLRGKETVNDLHNKASDWFKNNSMHFPAINHAIEAGNIEKSSQLLGDIAETLWENGNHSAIIKYGDLLPQELVKKNIDLCLYYSWILVSSGQAQKADSFLKCAEVYLRNELIDINKSKEVHISNKKALGKIAVAIAYQNSFLGQADKVFEYCKIAMENLSENDPLWFSWSWYSLGMAHFANENIIESTEALKKALEYGKISGNIYLITTIAITLSYNETRLGYFKLSHKRCSDLLSMMKESGYSGMITSEWSFAVLYANMAAIEYFWAELDEALETIKIADSLCVGESDIIAKALVLIVYSAILHAHGNTVETEKKLKQLEDLMKNNQISPNLKAMYIACKGGLLIFQNKLEDARMFFEVNGLNPSKKISYAEEHGYIAYAMLLLAEFKIDEALLLLDKLYHMAKSQNRNERLIEIKILYSLVYTWTGDKEKAIDQLVESMHYASDNEILMYYINYLPQIKEMFIEVFKRQQSGKLILEEKFLDKLKLAIAKRSNPIKVSTAEILSLRETDTLQLMAEGFSNQQIADKLFISLNTVKTHLKNVYAKLDVDTRGKAVEKGKSLRLI